MCLHQDTGSINGAQGPSLEQAYMPGSMPKEVSMALFPFLPKSIGLLGNLWQLLTHAGLFVKGGRVMGREVGFQSVGFRTAAPIQTHS